MRKAGNAFLPSGPGDGPLWSDRFLLFLFSPILPSAVLPNHLTALRFLLTPAVIWLLFYREWGWGAGLFGLAVLTDALDGALARTRRQITAWGKIYDPLADKILIAAVGFLVIPPFFGFGLLFVMVGVELLLVAGGYFRKDRLLRAIRANWWGKSKMICQSGGIFVILLAAAGGWPFLLPAALWLLYVAIVLAVVSLFTYSI